MRKWEAIVRSIDNLYTRLSRLQEARRQQWTAIVMEEEI
jgi:hypothetical protein